MENWNFVEILKVGLPGLIFLLSGFAYHLLSREQKSEKPRRPIIDAIKYFMNVNIFLAVLAASVPIGERFISCPNKLSIERIEFVSPPKLGTGEANLSHRQPAIYGQDEGGIGYIAKISGMTFDNNGDIKIRLKCKVESVLSGNIVTQCQDLDRTMANEWQGKMRGANISEISVKNIIGDVSDRQTIFFNSIDITNPSYSSTGEYRMIVTVEDQISGAVATRTTSFHIR